MYQVYVISRTNYGVSLRTHLPLSQPALAQVPPVLPAILKEWTKEVIRRNPTDIYAFSAQ